MSLSTQTFTQSLRLLDPINQQRIKSNKRILWPDYEILNLITCFDQASQKQQMQLNLKNLFIYCAFEENFIVRKTNIKKYLNVNQCYDSDFTHMAIWICKKYTSRTDVSKKQSNSPQNSRSLENKRKRSIQKNYLLINSTNLPQQIYIILSKKSIAIDQIIKTTHKICISIVPLSNEKFLWGGSLNFQEFQPTQSKDKQQNSLFQSDGQNFGFNINSKPQAKVGSFRKTNGMIDKRQLRFSNYLSGKKQHQEKNNILSSKQSKDCTNSVKIYPQHIRQHQQFLYIQIDLSTCSQLSSNSDEWNMRSVDIFGRHKKPKYGGKYEDQSSSSSDDDYDQESKTKRKYRRYAKEQIFLIYSMPFMSQLNYEDNQQLRQINFRGSCSMFSAMKRLQLKSDNKNRDENRCEQSPKQLSKGKKQRYEVSNNELNKNISIGNKQGLKQQLNRDILQDQNKMIQNCKNYNNNINGKWINNNELQIIQISNEGNDKNINDTYKVDKKQQQIKQLKNRLIKQIGDQFNRYSKQNDNEFCDKLIYIPVFNGKGFEPLRIGVRRDWLQYIDININNQIIKVQIQQGHIHNINSINNNQQQCQQIQIDEHPNNNMNKRNNKRNKNNIRRQSIYIGNSNNRKQYNVNNNNNNVKQIRYVSIDVYLTDKVYKEQSVYYLIQIMQRIQQNRLSQLSGINDVQELKNIFILLNDLQQYYINNNKQTINNKQMINNNKYNNKDIKYNNKDNKYIIPKIKSLIWMNILMKIDEMSRQQLQLIKLVKKQTQQLLNINNNINNINNNINKKNNNYKSNKQQQKNIFNINNNNNKSIDINQLENYYQQQIKIQQIHRQLLDRQNNIIQLILNYHQKPTIIKQVKYQLIKIYFYFINQQVSNNFYFIYNNNNKYNNHHNKDNNTIQKKQLKLQFQQQQLRIRIIKDIMNRFMLMNSKLIITKYKAQIQSILNLIQSIKYNNQNLDNLDNNQYKNQQNKLYNNQQQQIQIDKINLIHLIHLNNIQNNNNQSHNYNQQINFNYHHNQLLIINIFKSSIIYTIQHLPTIPIHIFLSQPLQQFIHSSLFLLSNHSQQSINKSQSIIHQHLLTNYNHKQSTNNNQQDNRLGNSSTKCDRLKRFINKYFIRGHNRFELQQNKLNSNIGNHNLYINIITDLLHIYMKIINIQQKELQQSQLNRQQRQYNISDSNNNRINIGNNRINIDNNNRINNVIQLINKEYNNSLIINPNIRYNKINNVQISKQNKNNNSYINNNNKKQTQQICRFRQNEMNNYNDQSKNNNMINNKIEQIINNNNNQYNVFNTSFLINNNNNYKINQINNHTNNNIINNVNNNINNNSNANNNNNANIQLTNTKQSIKLSNNKQQSSQLYNFILNIQLNNNNININNNNQSNNNNNYNYKQLNKQSFINSYILFKPIINKQSDQSYQINLLNTHLALNHSINHNHSLTSNHQLLFYSYQVYVQLQIIINKPNQQSKQSNKPFNPIYLQSKQYRQSNTQSITFKGSNILIFDNYNHSNITNNIITLTNLQKDNQLPSNLQLFNIHKVNIKIYSKQLPILSNSLTFINLRLNKYIKSLLPLYKQSNISKSRKTIGARFTQHLNQRQNTSLIQSNILKSNNKNISNIHNHNLTNISTLYDLPQIIIYHLLNTDKCYIQDQQKILKFIDQFYQHNQPIYQDYILYFAIRPSFLRLSALLKHYYQNQIKYQQSQILQTLIKTRITSSMNYSNYNKIQTIFTIQPRISSIKPLKNIKDTLQERQLLSKYMKDISKRNSLNKRQNNQSININNPFTKNNKIFEIKQFKKQQHKKQQAKDIQI